VRLNRCKYGTEEYFSGNSVHEAVFKAPWRNCQARNAEWWRNEKFSAQERSSGLGPPAPGLFITCRYEPDPENQASG